MIDAAKNWFVDLAISSASRQFVDLVDTQAGILMQNYFRKLGLPRLVLATTCSLGIAVKPETAPKLSRFSCPVQIISLFNIIIPMHRDLSSYFLAHLKGLFPSKREG